MEVGMHVDVACVCEKYTTWGSNRTSVHFSRRACVTCTEVALDDHLVLLLVPSCNDQIILWADEPQELLKPVERGENGQQDAEVCCSIRKTCFLKCLTSKPSGLSEWWSRSEPLLVFSGFSSQQISWPWMTWKMKYERFQTFFFVRLNEVTLSYLICSFNCFIFLLFSCAFIVVVPKKHRSTSDIVFKKLKCVSDQ